MSATGQQTLTTDRLLLRPFALADAKRVQLLAGHAKVAATTANIPHPYRDGMAEAWISGLAAEFEKGTSVKFAMTLRESGELIGCIDHMGISNVNKKSEIGYWVGVDYWGKGYCSEAMKAVVRYGFEVLKLNKITCRHMSTNPASGRVMQKAGMVHEGTFREDFFKDGAFVDMEFYGMLRRDFELRQHDRDPR